MHVTKCRKAIFDIVFFQLLNRSQTLKRVAIHASIRVMRLSQ